MRQHRISNCRSRPPACGRQAKRRGVISRTWKLRERALQSWDPGIPGGGSPPAALVSQESVSWSLVPDYWKGGTGCLNQVSHYGIAFWTVGKTQDWNQPPLAGWTTISMVPLIGGWSQRGRNKPFSSCSLLVFLGYPISRMYGAPAGTEETDLAEPQPQHQEAEKRTAAY